MLPSPTGPSTEHTSAGTEGARELVAMSEDGAREVYVGRGEAKGVWLTDRSIPQTWRLTTGDHFNPAISDDGDTIAYVEYGSTPAGLRHGRDRPREPRAVGAGQQVDERAIGQRPE